MFKKHSKSKKQVDDSTGIYRVSRTATVEKRKYCLLALFLGWCGFHKFYEGRIITGAYYLLGSLAAILSTYEKGNIQV